MPCAFTSIGLFLCNRVIFFFDYFQVDRKEGMTAFIEKRPAKFNNE